VAQVFFITNLGKDQIILGYPWLREFDSQINWKDGKVHGPPIKLSTMGRSWKLKWAARRTKACKTSFSQQWAQREGKGQSKVAVPEQFQKYAKVFSKEEAKCFSPS
jgi:hypothetical protein